VQVLIDTSNKEDAELISRLLPRPAEARFARGFGLVRVLCRSTREVSQVVEAARAAAEQHDLAWLRVRVGDDEQVFRHGRPAE
jgi:hypothetical protein